MKKFLPLILLFLAAGPAQAGSVQFSTYYPAPFGMYDRLRLVPRASLGGTCDAVTQSGTFYYETGVGLRLCDESTATWGPLGGGVWTQSGNNIYPADTTTNPNLKVGIGTTTPTAPLSIARESVGTNQIVSLTYSRDAVYSNRLDFQRTRGTLAAPTTTLAGDWLGEIGFQSFNGSAYGGAAHMSARASADGRGGDIYFDTSASGTSSSYDRMSIMNNGDIYLANIDGSLNNATMFVGISGNVGIGTACPKGRLHIDVNGNTDCATLASIGDDLIVGINGSIGMGTTPDVPPAATSLYIKDDSSERLAKIGLERTSTARYSGIDFLTTGIAAPEWTLMPSIESGGTPGDFEIWEDNSTVRFLIQNATGNVGIGAATPNARLQIEGNVPGGTFDALRIRNSANQSSSRIVFEEDSQGDNASIKYHSHANTDDNWLEFWGFAVPIMTLQRDDSSVTRHHGVGIGVPEDYNVAARLEVWNNKYNEDILNLVDSDANNDGTANDPVEVFTVLDGGNVGIGTKTPTEILTIVGENKDVEHYSYSSAGPGSKADYDFLRARGTEVAPLPVQNGDYLGTVRFRGFDTANAFQAESAPAADIAVAVDGAPGAGIMPTRMEFHTSGTIAGSLDQQRMVIKSSGNVGIGTTAPSNLLTIVQTSATDPIADAWTTYSSKRWKTNIKQIEGALNKIKNLRGVYFDWTANGKHDIGMIAEEVGKVVPELVVYEENGVDARSLDYARLTALLTEAIKEQQKQIDALKNEIQALKRNQ